MSEPDIVTRRYMANPERFADAFNYAVYGGEQVINPRELVPLDTVLTGKTNKGSSVERRRDGLKRWQAMCDDHTEYAILGIEDQTYLDAGMPVRGMLYDALSYQDQLDELKKKNKQEKLLSEKEWLSGIREDDRILPVATLVVYFGSDEWVMARSVHELLKTHDARLLPFIPDYRINIITPFDLNNDDLSRFKTDLGIVMGYIKYENDKKGLADLASHNESFRNVGPESVEVINTLTNSHFKVPTGKRGLNMCKAIEDMRNESYQQGREYGEQIGREYGERRTFSKIFHKMAKDSKKTEQELLDYLGVPEADRAAVVAGFDDKQ